ncbi:MAG: hypothetical protein DI558_12720, partial [Corynebacterium propinquum]
MPSGLVPVRGAGVGRIVSKKPASCAIRSFHGDLPMNRIYRLVFNR